MSEYKYEKNYLGLPPWCIGMNIGEESPDWGSKDDPYYQGEEDGEEEELEEEEEEE